MLCAEFSMAAILLECTIPAGDDLFLIVHNLFEIVFMGVCPLRGCA